MPRTCKYGSRTCPLAKRWESQRNQLKSPADTQSVVEKVQEVSLTSEPAHETQSTINMKMLDTGMTLEVTPLPPNVPNIYPLPDQTPQMLMERMYQLYEVTWATTDLLSVGAYHDLIDPFLLLFNKSLNLEIAAYFSYFRADLELHFRLNTNQFYSGKLAISAYPGQLSTRAYNFLSARMWHKPKLISAQSQDTFILRLPWVDPHRFGPVPPQAWMWSLCVDVVAPLRVAAANAPESILMNIQGRFINPQLIAPFDGADSRTIHKQSSYDVWGHAKKLEKARTRKVQVHKTTRRADPVQSASTIGKAVSMLLPETTTATIEHGTNLIMDLLSKIQPFAQVALSLAALFDKPNQVQLTTRTLTQPGSNMPRCDEPDPAMPLTLYKTSYLGADPGVLPDGKAWTLREMAMVPMLYAMWPYTSTETVNSIYLGPAGGSPWLACWALHAFSRGSTRIRVDFSSSTFLSARFLFTYVPAYRTGTPTQEIDNNVVQLVDVKGDTSVEFTVPFVSPFDMLNRYSSQGELYVTLYDAIASIDTVADPTIDLIVWVAAGPDVQFSSPSNPPPGSGTLWQGATYDPETVHKQCDIVDSFKYEFPPFVDGCAYATDNHYVTSETSEYVTDILKRYVWYSPASAPVNLSDKQLPLEYTPTPNSLQWLLKNCFAFHRGGVSYKLYLPRTPTTTTTSGNITMRYDETSLGTNEMLDGSAGILQGDSADQMEISVPWMWWLPYYQFTPGQSPSQPNTADLMYGDNYPNTSQLQCAQFSYASTVTPYYYTCVRDDYSVGFLQQPPLTPEFLGVKGKKKLTTFHKPAASVLRENAKKLSAKSFVPLKAGFFGTSASGKQPSK